MLIGASKTGSRTRKPLGRLNAVKPRDYQEDSVTHTFADLKKDPDCTPVIVLPTGGGKSVVIARALQILKDANYRAIILCRTKELVEQNHARFLEMCPLMEYDTGVYCAGLGRKDRSQRFIFATAQSVARQPTAFGFRNIVLVDECHQVPDRDDSQYQQIMDGMREANASVRLVGLTATPYRVDGGYLVGEGKTFSHISYEKPLREMVEEGHLTPLNHVDVNKVDLSKVAIVRGDFDPRQMSGAFEQCAARHASEVFGYAEENNVNSCLVFTSSVAHAKIVKEHLEELSGDTVGLVHGETSDALRDETIQRFKDEDIRFVVNVNVLTTGFDAPNIDMIVLLRATCSHSLYYQMVGRGMRKFPAKDVCHLIDYGDHVARLGDVTGDNFGKDCDSFDPAPDDDDSEEMSRSFEPMPKVCKKCQHARSTQDIWDAIHGVAKAVWPEGNGFFNDYTLYYEKAREIAENIATNGKATWPKELTDAGNMLREQLEKCPNAECGWAYSAQVIDVKPDVRDEEAPTEKVLWDVKKVTTKRHKSNAGKYSLRVTYHCSREGQFRMFSDYIGFDGHAGFAKRKWRQLSLADYPENTEDAVTMAMAGAVGIPDQINVWREKGWDRVEPVQGFYKPSNQDLIYE